MNIFSCYIDIGGAGYIVTISYVIFEKRQRNAAAIVSMDVTLGFLYQVIESFLKLISNTYLLFIYLFFIIIYLILLSLLSGLVAIFR